MTTRTRSHLTNLEAEKTEALELEQLPDDELEQLLFEDEGSPTRQHSAWNLPTVAGLALLLVGMMHVLQRMGLWSGVDVSTLVGFLPWVAALLILLLGLGVLSWRPRRRPRRRPKPNAQAQKPLNDLWEQSRKVFADLRTTLSSGKTDTPQTTTENATASPTVSKTKRLVKSRDRMLAGVCGGIAAYLGWDPTLIRALFVLSALFFSGFPLIVVYLILAWIMPEPDPTDKSQDNTPRIRILPE